MLVLQGNIVTDKFLSNLFNDGKNRFIQNVELSDKDSIRDIELYSMYYHKIYLIVNLVKDYKAVKSILELSNKYKIIFRVTDINMFKYICAILDKDKKYNKYKVISLKTIDEIVGKNILIKELSKNEKLKLSNKDINFIYNNLKYSNTVNKDIFLIEKSKTKKEIYNSFNMKKQLRPSQLASNILLKENKKNTGKILLEYSESVNYPYTIILNQIKDCIKYYDIFKNGNATKEQIDDISKDNIINTRMLNKVCSKISLNTLYLYRIEMEKAKYNNEKMMILLEML